MRYLLHPLPSTKKDADQIGAVDPLLVGRAGIVFERREQLTSMPGK